MKRIIQILIISLALALNNAAQAKTDCVPTDPDFGVEGKVFSPGFMSIPDTQGLPVVAVRVDTGETVVGLIDQSGYTLLLAPCATYRIGIISTRGYYFRTIVFTTPGERGFGAYVDFEGILKRTRRREHDNQ